MLAFLGSEKLRDLNNDKPKEAAALCNKFFRSLSRKDPAYDDWKEKTIAGVTAVIEASRQRRYSELIVTGPWADLLSARVKDRIRRAAATHKPTTEREKFLFGLGGDRPGRMRDFPTGKPMSAETGVGLQFVTIDGHLLELGSREEVEVELELTSFVGMSIGANHTYAKFCCFHFLPEARVLEVEKIRGDVNLPQVGSLYGSGGYGDFVKPRLYQLHNISVERPLSTFDFKEARRRGRPDRYSSYKVGDYTDGFWTEKDAVEYSKRVFGTLFDERTVKLKLPEGVS